MKVDALSKCFGKENMKVDALSKLTSRLYPAFGGNILKKTLTTPSVDLPKVLNIAVKPCWMYKIVEHKKTSVLTLDPVASQ